MAIAQTFVNPQGSGCYITSIDLFFSAKDTVQPITLAITDTVQSRPGAKILPYSTVTLNASEVNTSTDASTATKFTFDSPVFLKGGQTYSFGLHSNSNKYSLYIAELGQTEIGTTRRVSEQPAVGSLFKSQNASGQNESPTQDLKFLIRRADFTTNTTGTVTLVNEQVIPDILDDDPIETNATAGSGTTFGDNPAIIKINHKNHGMNDDKPDKVTIAGLTDATDYNGILGSAINGTHDIGNVTLDSYTITISGDTATSSGRIGGDEVTATRNLAYETLTPQFGFIQPDATTVITTVIPTSKQSVHGSETSYTAGTEVEVAPNDNYYFTEQQQVASQINETTHFSGNKSLTYNIQMSTDNRNLSPVIDITRLNTILTTNRLNNPSASNTTGFIEETEPSGGSAAAKYITREITLDNPATSLDVRISANNFPTSAIKMLYKIRHVDDSRPFDEIPYVYFNTTGLADDAVRYSESRSQSPNSEEYDANYFEQRFTAEGLGEFTAFAVKMVMTGTNPAYPPRVTDLRAIALAK